jgi:hypothetical protein
VRTRPLPRYALVAVQDHSPTDDVEEPADDPADDLPLANPAQDPARPEALLQEPPALAAARGAGHAASGIARPFGVHPLPFDVGEDPWSPASERRRSAVLAQHSECFESLDVLDDLAAAMLLHGQVDQPPVRERLLRPVLERAAAIVEAALASAGSPPAPPSARRASFRTCSTSVSPGRPCSMRA